jgi:hypothetical protein
MQSKMWEMQTCSKQPAKHRKMRKEQILLPPLSGTII